MSTNTTSHMTSMSLSVLLISICLSSMSSSPSYFLINTTCHMINMISIFSYHSIHVIHVILPPLSSHMSTDTTSHMTSMIMTSTIVIVSISFISFMLSFLLCLDACKPLPHVIINVTSAIVTFILAHVIHIIHVIIHLSLLICKPTLQFI